MPSEFNALHRELEDRLTPEQIEEQEENIMMCTAEEEGAYNESIELDELKEKDQDSEILEMLLSFEEIQFQHEVNYTEEIEMRELISMMGILTPSGKLSPRPIHQHQF